MILLNASSYVSWWTRSVPASSGRSPGGYKHVLGRVRRRRRRNCIGQPTPHVTDGNAPRFCAPCAPRGQRRPVVCARVVRYPRRCWCKLHISHPLSHSGHSALQGIPTTSTHRQPKSRCRAPAPCGALVPFCRLHQARPTPYVAPSTGLCVGSGSCCAALGPSFYPACIQTRFTDLALIQELQVTPITASTVTHR